MFHEFSSVAPEQTVGERASAEAASDRGGFAFALTLFVLSHASLLIVRDLDVSLWDLLSYIQQQAIVYGVFLLVDRWIASRSARFVWASLGVLYATCITLDGLLMRMTSLPLREILPMLLASQHVVEGLREIGLKPVRLLVLLSLLVGAVSAGGFMRLKLGQWLAHSRGTWFHSGWLGAAVLGLLVSFTSEQSLSRDAPDYLYRGFRMPSYVQLYSTSSKSVVVPLTPPVEHSTRAQWLAQIGPAKNPRHVLYVLLESFRSDIVNPTVTPSMWRLAQQGLSFDNALAEATYTPLSWSVLLFDEPAHDNLFGRHSGRPEPLGSWLLAVMRKAGYQPHVSVSTNLTYAKTRERLLGQDRDALDFFQAAADVGDDPSDKNDNDRVAVDHMLRFIRAHIWDDKPQFMLVQLDSTHYTYPFPEDEAIFRPYSENLTLPVAIENQEQAALLRNRYLNAAHYVDSQLSRVIAALQEEGVYDNTAVVVTADHGEGLSPGLQGHAAVYDATRRVPLIFKLPGEAPGHSRQLISHRDILPTLARYLGIALPPGTTRGRAAGDGPPDAVLTLAPSGHSGQLTTQDGVMDFRLLFKPSAVIVTPAAPRSGRPAVPPSEWMPLMRSFLHGEVASSHVSNSSSERR